MPSRQEKIASICFEQAQHSKITIKHGAVITNGSKIICKGHNLFNRTKILDQIHSCTHAEMDVANQLVQMLKRKIKRGVTLQQLIKKYKIWVIRIPNDYDIESTIYHHERRELAKRSITFKRKQLRNAKLSMCLPCDWNERVEIKLVGVGSMGSLTATQSTPTAGSSVLGQVGGMIFGRSETTTISASGANANTNTPWRSVYVALQGRRLVWWASERDIVDESSQPEGQLLLYGHAGTTDASPVDEREAGKDNLPRMTAIYGNDVNGMHMKCTVLCKTVQSKERLCHRIQTIVNSPCD